MNTSALVNTSSSALVNTSNGSSDLIVCERIKKPEMVINPLSLTLSKNEFIDESYGFERTVEQIKNELINGELDTTANVEGNEKLLMTIQSIALKLPQLPHIHQQKLIVPEFDEIEVERSDSAEIKKFIRKVNYEFIGYHCNHSTADKNCDLVFKNTADIYTSQEYKHYVDFMKKLASNVWNIRYTDKRNKKWKDEHLMPTGDSIQTLIDDIIKLSGNIQKYNAVMNPECSKCKAAVRKHNYALKEIQRMRDELKEQQMIDEEYKDKPAEDEYNIDEFMNKNYPSIDRFPLSDVKEKYKATFKLSITYDKLIQLIESTGKFKITNCKRVYYVTRL